MRWSNAYLIGSSLALSACMPDIPEAAAPRFVELQYDPAATPAQTFQPTSLVLNANTGLIDLSIAGVDVPGVPEDPAAAVTPESCQSAAGMSVAQCEFYQYLERLDGFPTLFGAQTPSSAALDLNSVTHPRNLFVYDVTHAETVRDLAIGFDSQANELLFDAPTGWEIGTTYAVGLRGYGHGIRSQRGLPVVASTIYALLKRASSLTCGAATPEQVDPYCDAYTVLEADPSVAKLAPAAKHAAIAANLFQLEQLRQFYRGSDPTLPIDLWKILNGVGRMPTTEVAIAWTFVIHTGSVAELDPQRGLVPEVVSSSEIRLSVKGTLDSQTLAAFSLMNGGGTVFLLDIDKLQVDPTDPAALPPFDVKYVNEHIVLTTTDAKYPFVASHTYAVLLTDELHDLQGRPLVASPVAVLLRTRGALTDAHGVSQVSGVGDDDAQQLEGGRSQFARLLDDPLIIAATTSAARPVGLVREHIVYLYGFEFPHL